MDLAELYELFDSDPAPVVAFLRWLVETHELPGPPTVLDVGCGPGRLLAVFADLGWPVHGLEPNAAYFARASQRASSWPGVVVRRGGFGDIDAMDVFDLVVAMNGPFSYLLTPLAREDAARRAFAALRPGGLLVLGLANFPWILKHYRKPPKESRTLGTVTVTRAARYDLDFHDLTWIHTDHYVVREGGRKVASNEMVHHMSILGYPEVARVLELAGFEDLRTYNDYEARRNERLSGEHMLVSARKSAS